MRCCMASLVVWSNGCSQYRQGSQSFTDKKIQDFPGLPWQIFQNLFVAHDCLNIKKKVSIEASKVSRKNFELLYAAFK